MSWSRKALKGAVVVSPALGATPGIMATVVLAAPSCGFQFSELRDLYPSASVGLQTVAVFGALMWVIWIVAFLRRSKWSSTVHARSLPGRIAVVGSFLGGIALGVVISLVAYSLVAGVEDMCERVQAPISLIVLLFLLVPVFLVYVGVEVALEQRSKGARA